MAITNKVSMVISQETITKIQTAIQAMYSDLPPLINLSNEERHMLPKMGDKSVSFVSKAHEYAIQNPNVVPKFLDMVEYTKDVDAVNQLFQVAAPLLKLAEELNDTMMMAGSEAFTESRIFYKALKTAIDSGETGLKYIYDDLSTRFPGRPPKST